MDFDHDPMLLTLGTALQAVQSNHEQRQAARRERGDAPTSDLPYITVSIDVAHRTYYGRIFTVPTYGDTTVEVHDFSTANPDHPLAAPPTLIRVSAIQSVKVDEKINLLPVEFPMKRDDLDAHIDRFLATAARAIAETAAYAGEYDSEHPVRDILADLAAQTEPIAITYKTCDVLREAAQPVNDLILNSSIPGQWERFARTVCDASGMAGHKIMAAEDSHEHLNIVVINTDDPKPGPNTLLAFLTHGVPTDFLYPETHDNAIDTYLDDLARVWTGK